MSNLARKLESLPPGLKESIDRVEALIRNEKSEKVIRHDLIKRASKILEEANSVEEFRSTDLLEKIKSLLRDYEVAVEKTKAIDIEKTIDTQKEIPAQGEDDGEAVCIVPVGHYFPDEIDIKNNVSKVLLQGCSAKVGVKINTNDSDVNVSLSELEQRTEHLQRSLLHHEESVSFKEDEEARTVNKAILENCSLARLKMNDICSRVIQDAEDTSRLRNLNFVVSKTVSDHSSRTVYATLGVGQSIMEQVLKSLYSESEKDTQSELSMSGISAICSSEYKEIHGKKKLRSTMDDAFFTSILDLLGKLPEYSHDGQSVVFSGIIFPYTCLTIEHIIGSSYVLSLLYLPNTDADKASIDGLLFAIPENTRKVISARLKDGCSEAVTKLSFRGLKIVVHRWFI